MSAIDAKIGRALASILAQDMSISTRTTLWDRSGSHRAKLQSQTEGQWPMDDAYV